MGPVHLDLFQLDVAHSVVGCILSCLFLLCTTFYVGSSVSLFLYLVLCMCFIHPRFSRSFSPSLSCFEWIFIPISSCFSFCLFSFCSLFGCESGCFYPTFLKHALIYFFSMCTKNQRLVSWHFAIYYWSLAGSVFHGTEGQVVRIYRLSFFFFFFF